MEIYLAVGEKDKFFVHYITETKEKIDIIKTSSKIVREYKITVPTTDGNRKEYNRIQCTDVITISRKKQNY